MTTADSATDTDVAEQDAPHDERPQPTLADYLAARDEELRKEDDAANERIRSQAENERTQKLDQFARLVDDGFTAYMRGALNLGDAIYCPDNDYETNGYYSSVEAAFTHEGETWTLYLWNGNLNVRGPNGYHQELRQEWVKGNKWHYHRSLLDALRHYPAWLKEKQDRDAENARALAAEDEPRAPEPPKPALYCEGQSSRCFLRDGVMVVIEMANFGPQYIGTIAAYSKRDILLTLDDGSQLLINRRQASTIAYYEKPAIDEVPF